MHGTFATAINCIDGRTHLPVIQFMREHCNVDYVDVITEPGPDKIMAELEETAIIESILSRVNISIQKHNSSTIAIVGHFDCAGNPVPEKIHKQQLAKAVDFLKEEYPDKKIIALWLNEEAITG
jgi:hypothetical protein